MMVSFSHLFTFISLLSAVCVTAEDTSSQKSGSLDAKFLGSYYLTYNPASFCRPAFNPVAWLNRYCSYNPNFYSYAYSQYRYRTGYGYRYWFKSESSQQKRRSIQLRSEGPQSAGGAVEQNNVECKGPDGKSTVFNTHECHQAAAKLVSERSSKSVYGKCGLSIVGSQGPLIPAGVTTSELQAITQNMLKACTSGASHSQSKRTPAEANSGSLEKGSFEKGSLEKDALEKGSFAMFLTAAH